ncbi:hypothetical protein G4V62_10405 [Bacillaceae bacterium SIJ1]|uniref:hypothetical protein n=1 Tax=Litoribacterium kuwaitense TaxID=1398745 RepID=UPI0013EC1B92|nr:hypothetical protein [Litoribacterium kuwaitense]NGP45344.1 hypothetical protein [Litoribacterium kuwaitense]
MSCRMYGGVMKQERLHHHSLRDTGGIFQLLQSCKLSQNCKWGLPLWAGLSNG